MRYLHALAFVTLFISMTACKTEAVRAEVAAQIVDPTPESRAELEQAVSDALGGRSVTIADDALTTDSMLIIEPKHLTGRDLRRPDHFRLVREDSRCVLVHQESEARYTLSDTRCAADSHR